MPATKLEKFGGLLPMWEPHLLPEGQASDAVNCYLFSGALLGWREPKLLRQLTSSTSKFAYRLPTVTQSVASAYLIFIAKPNPGDTLTLGDEVYTWVSSLTGAAAFSVLTGANSTESATNIFNAFTRDNGAATNAGVLYSSDTSANPAIATLNAVAGHNNGQTVTPFGPAISLISPDIGAAYNSTLVDESTAGARTYWSSSSLALVSTTTFTGGVNATFDPTITGSSQFLEFDDPDTNVLKSQVVSDQYQRYYFGSPSVTPKYNTTPRIQAGSAPWILGINGPTLSPTVSVSGGGNTGTQGITTTQGASQFAFANQLYLTAVTPSATVQILNVQFVPTATHATAHWRTVLYADVAGEVAGATASKPGILLNQSPGGTGLLSGTIHAGAFTNPSTLSQSVPYWIGFELDTTCSVQNGDGVSLQGFFLTTFANGPPTTAPVFTQTTTINNFKMYMEFATADVIESRSYVYTWVSAYGEESAPSPYTLVNGWSNGTWTIGLFPPSSEDLGVNRNLAVVRLYRTITGSSGVTSYFQVTDISLGSSDTDAVAFVAADTGCLAPTTTVTDSAFDNIVALNFELASTNFFPPPADLVGLVTMPNGMMAGFKKNEIWFCEPYFPHAWPSGYTISVDFPVVGLGVTNGAIVACTSATPYVVSGVAPGQMNTFKCVKPEPCTSRGSIISLESGVHYISPNGLIRVPNTGQLENLTSSWIARENWQKLVPQSNTRAITLASTYFCFSTDSPSDGFNIELDIDSTSFTIWPQPGGHRLGFMPMTSPLDFTIDNVFVDPWTGQGILLMNGAEYWYDFSDQAPTIQAYQWKSRIYQSQQKKNFSALRVFCTVPAGTPAQNPYPNTAVPTDPSWDSLQAGQWAIVKVWADPNNGQQVGQMQLVMARELRRNAQLMRLPDGFKAENWQFEVLARVAISNIQVATSVQELNKV